MAEREDQTDLPGSKISVPTLILVGAEDAITQWLIVRRCITQSGSRLVVLENAGHVSNLERTEQFNQALLDFQKESSN